MVVPSLAIGGAVGVILSGAFIWWELGRFASPQVPITIFDERKLLAAYTAGLFIGVPLAVVYLLFTVALGNGALLGGVLFLVGLVGGAELAQYLVLRTTYWGGHARPFYALALRAGFGAILVLTVLTGYLGTVPIALTGAPAIVATVLAVLALEVTGGLLTLAPTGRFGRPGFRPLSGIAFGLVGFFLIGLGLLAGQWGALAGSVVALAGALTVYRRLRPMLHDVPAPGATGGATEPGTPLAYGRTGGAEGEGPGRPR
jgi:hypothetical protein